MIITLENDQDKLQISEELEQLLTAGLNVVARLHSLRGQKLILLLLMMKKYIC